MQGAIVGLDGIVDAAGAQVDRRHHLHPRPSSGLAARCPRCGSRQWRDRAVASRPGGALQGAGPAIAESRRRRRRRAPGGTVDRAMADAARRRRRAGSPNTSPGTLEGLALRSRRAASARAASASFSRAAHDRYRARSPPAARGRTAFPDRRRPPRPAYATRAIEQPSRPPRPSPRRQSKSPWESSIAGAGPTRCTGAATR